MLGSSGRPSLPIHRRPTTPLLLIHQRIRPTLGTNRLRLAPRGLAFPRSRSIEKHVRPNFLKSPNRPPRTRWRKRYWLRKCARLAILLGFVCLQIESSGKPSEYSLVRHHPPRLPLLSRQQILHELLTKYHRSVSPTLGYRHWLSSERRAKCQIHHLMQLDPQLLIHLPRQM